MMKKINFFLKELIEAGKKIKGEIEIATKEANGLKQELDKMLSTCGNIVHDSVPIHHDEKFNEIVRTWGEPRQLKITGKKGACHHHQVLYMIGGYDPKRGQKISGHRKNELFLIMLKRWIFLNWIRSLTQPGFG